MGTDPPNVTRLLGQIQNRGERIHHKVEQEWGDRVTLTDSLASREVRANLPIDVNRRPATRNQLHYSCYPVGVKATFQQHFPKEGPVHSIIGFMEIDLEEDRTEVFALNLMDNLMEGKNPI